MLVDTTLDPKRSATFTAFPITTNLITDVLESPVVYLRRFDTPTITAGKNLRDLTRRRGAHNIPYSIATAALSGYSDGYVHLSKFLDFVVSTRPILDEDLQRALAYTEACALDADPYQAVRSGNSHWADLAARTPEQKIDLADCLGLRHGQPDLEGWVFHALPWFIAQHLASADLKVHELLPAGEKNNKRYDKGPARHIPLLTDNQGRVWAWDDPIGPRHNPCDPQKKPQRPNARYALMRFDTRIKTFPDIPHPIALIDSHVARVNTSLLFSTTAVVRNHSEGADLLALNLVKQAGLRSLNRHALQVQSLLGLNTDPLRTVQTRFETEKDLLETARSDKEKFVPPEPDPARDEVRCALPKNQSWPVGTGGGLHQARLLSEHINATFKGQAELVQAVKDKISLPTSDGKIVLPTPDDVLASLNAYGLSDLRVLCLYYRAQTRIRMIRALNAAFGDRLGTDPADGQEHILHTGQVSPDGVTPTISVVFIRTEQFLAPGEHNRSREMTSLEPHLNTPDQTLAAAWCETEIPQPPKKKPNERRDAYRRRARARDAKPITCQLLAERGIITQYLIGTEDGEVLTPEPGKDHRAQMAFADLYRSCGVIDDRITTALSGVQPKAEGPTPSITYLGVHVRKQSRQEKGKGRGEPKRIVCATALMPPIAESGVWTLWGWSSTDQTWRPYPQALAVFHAGHLAPHHTGSLEDEVRWREAAGCVEEAVRTLAARLDRECPGMGYAVMVDAVACRRMWPGLHNDKQGLGIDDMPGDERIRLPGYAPGTKEPYRPVGVVRINTSDQETLPLGRVTDPNEKFKTSNGLYRIPASNSPLWVLLNTARNYRGKAPAGSPQRPGTYRTRWHARQIEGDLKASWYVPTTTEIYPVAVDEQRTSPLVLARATARLCNQTMAWVDRSRYPVPLHAAKQMDDDHPEFRRDEVVEIPLDDGANGIDLMDWDEM
ncbi:RNaseH domain-containing protein [Nocardiopsis alba]|uniref:RNaseH domain-containing protein n=1 Tax=Nocardiopsis alba TaxID=53437 RepID=UPI003401B817